MSCFSSPLWAQDDPASFTDNTTGITYTILDDTGELYSVEVTSYSGSKASIDLTGTVTYNDGTDDHTCSITAIGDAVFQNCSDLTSVTLPTSVTNIGDEAFSGCTSLETIDNLSYVTSIGKSAFADCEALSVSSGTLDLSSATSIGDGAFSGCTALASSVTTLLLSGITSSSNIDMSMFSSWSLTYIDLSSLESVSTGMFSDCSSTLETLILSSATKVDDNAFSGCSALKTLNLASVKTISSDYFSDCKSTLETLDISKVETIKGDIFSIKSNDDYSSNFPNLQILDISGATSIDANVFENCTSLEEVILGSNLQSIDNDAFNGCTALTSIGESDLLSLTTIGNNAFSDCTMLCEPLDLSHVTSLGRGAFYNCSSLISVLLTNTGLTAIGDQTFQGCSSLTSIGEGTSIDLSHVLSIGEEAFYGCTNLGKTGEETAELALDISGVTGDKLGNKAFYNCAITSVKLSDELTNIQQQTFYGCSYLTAVTTATHTASIGLPSDLQIIGYSAFEECNKLAGTLDFATTNVSSIAQKAFHNCALITSVNFPVNVSSNESDTYSIAYQLFQGCTSLETVTFYGTISSTSSITSIDRMAFSGCTSLSSFPNIPSTVETIDYQAFYNCTKLTSVTLNDGLTEIDYQAFAKSGITSVEIPSTVKTWGNTTISNNQTVIQDGNYAFANCTSLETVELEEGLTIVGTYTFEGCNNALFTTITIPESMETVGEYAFKDCTNLVTIDYKATACTSFEEGVFSGCGTENNLVTLNIETPVEKIPQKLGDITYLGTVNYKPTYDGVTIIDSEGAGTAVADLTESIFKDCEYFTTLTIETGVVSLDKYMFKNCAHLEDVTYNAKDCTTNSVDNSEPPFYGCNKISSITIGEQVTQIPDLLFCAKKSDNFADLNGTIEIPASVKSIGKRSFQYCKSLTTVDIKGNTTNGTTIGGHAFQYAEALNSLTLGEGITEIGVDNDNNNDDEAGDAFADCIALTSVTLPKSLTTIGPQAFYGCTDLSTLEFQSDADSKLATIGNAAFFACKSLTEVKIPTSVTSIGNQAFQNCGSLNNVEIPGNTAGTTIGYDAFSRTFNSYPLERDGYEAGAGDMTLTIGENVTSIGASAFWNNGNLKTIYYNAKNCTLTPGVHSDFDSSGDGYPTTNDSPIFDT
ncbi:MAG: leucine-rich repeat protein, partial [Prevotella sp.]|nr:leucine-rich repeat protein [Prevotella sp.]